MCEFSWRHKWEELLILVPTWASTRLETTQCKWTARIKICCLFFPPIHISQSLEASVSTVERRRKVMRGENDCWPPGVVFSDDPSTRRLRGSVTTRRPPLVWSHTDYSHWRNLSLGNLLYLVLLKDSSRCSSWGDSEEMLLINASPKRSNCRFLLNTLWQCVPFVFLPRILSGKTIRSWSLWLNLVR